jgi:HEAT repeat protein
MSASRLSIIFLYLFAASLHPAPAVGQTTAGTQQADADQTVAQMRGFSMQLPATTRDTAHEARRRDVTRRLRELGATAIPALVHALRDPDAQMRRNAALVLINLGGGYSEEARPPLDIRGALPALIEATRDPDSDVRAWAAHAIAEMGPAGAPALPALMSLLRDPAEGPRNNSCMALGRIGPAAAVALPALRDALKDPSHDVRRFAQNAINRIEKK